MKLFNLIILLILFVASCAPDKQPADMLVFNANVYTVNSDFSTAKSFVIKDGKILDVGVKPELELKYKIAEKYDADGRTIVPGLIDAHAHLYGLGLWMQNVDLTGTESLQAVLGKLKEFEVEKQPKYIVGRGWDQNDWEQKDFPSKEALDSLFPDIPVALTRIDGHAIWVNSKMLELAKIDATTQPETGEILLKEGQPSGILVDVPDEMIDGVLPKITRERQANALLEATKICLENGLTTVNDAGLDKQVIFLIDSLQNANKMKLRMYTMVANTPDNLDYFLNEGIYKTDRLDVRSIKVYADGALGSRGAALKKPYSDQPGHFGAMITRADELDALAQRIAQTDFQMNTHAIGDSANISVIRAYKNALKGRTDARWKIEHAQIVSPQDFENFSNNIIPSVQPTHATSDMYWAEDRIGSTRMKGAYAYKTLLEKAGIIALGTDFPVEKVNPMYTFYAAVARKDLKHYPEEGFQKKDALSREEALKGMTIWAAYSNFEENEKGSIEAGKFADFTVLDRDIMKVEEDSIPTTKVLATFINGEAVFKSKETTAQ